ncbi:hypothetical protein [Hansschlegelia zhihuaiae]|uniref:Uncharacterized protein n=1 Tax=Hansschlegelia zhihuaiae TaxID=405005 RepID=A0A4Q0M5Y8_9HYPH|nr:hypothetical protein [Hansschlegelia zhihuaiae]RXF68076.1 hypothetical protein EK403_20435 [Hansschlegelia zhihuaiae]
MAGHGCGCGGDGSNGPVRYNATSVQLLTERARTFNQAAFDNPNLQTSLLAVGPNLALEILSSDENDKKSLVFFQRAGTFNILDLDLCKFDLDYPKIEVEICFEISPLGDGPLKIKGKIRIECLDISNPSGCSISIDLGETDRGIQALINWDCLKQCAPQCLYCGGNWQCWLACAGGCIIQCL